MPRISVIISTYNGDRFLLESVQSILDQSFDDFELIVVNDGSSDNTAGVLQTFADKRIRIVNNDQNLGIAASQNKALNLAGGEYLALMDHDDISLPQRLQKQVEFLDDHPSVGMVGSACIAIDQDNTVKSINVNPSDDIFLKWRLLIYDCPIAHTSLMVRRQALEKIGGYSGHYRYAGDYELLSKLAATNEVANITQPLVMWRMHNSTSIVHEDHLLEEARQISRDNIEAILGKGKLDESVFGGLRLLLSSRIGTPINISGEQVESVIEFLLDLQQRFYSHHEFSPASIKQHRQAMHLMWGKHFLALALGRNGKRDLNARVKLLNWSIRFLQRRVFSK